MSIIFFAYTLIFVFGALGIHLVFIQPNKSLMDNVLLVFLCVAMLNVLSACIFRDVMVGYLYVDYAAPFGLIYGPLLYFGYSCTLDRKISRKSVFLHLIPFSLFLIVFLVFVSWTYFRETYSSVYYSALYAITVLSWAAYPMFLILKGRPMRSNSSSIFRYAMIILITLASFFLPLIVIRASRNTAADIPVFRLIVFVAMLLGVVLVYFHLLEQLKLASAAQSEAKEANLLPAKAVEEDVKVSPVLEIPAHYFLKIQQYLAKDRFLNASFKLADMSKELGVTKYLISQYFQQVYQDSFVRKVNSWRIAYACQLLLKPDVELNMEDLAFKCGFSSRASFYRNFNQEKACTPLEYRENYTNSKAQA